MFQKKFSFSKKIILLSFLFFLVIFQNIIFAADSSLSRENEFYERTIRGTPIMHVALEPNANANSVLNYIKQNINPQFDGSVSSTPSYNSDRNGSIHWYIKGSENGLLAVYFDGGSREKRDGNYDFIDLRWLGNGSPHMYCFWKIEGVNVLEHNNVIMGKPALIKKLALKEIFKEIAKEVTNKTIKTISFGNFLIVGAAGLAREKLVDAVADILELNPNALEVASKVISNVEDMVMGAVDVVDDIPVVRDMARGVLEGFKTVGKATSYPVNVFKEVIKNVSNTNNYKKIENPLILDFAEVENIIIENIIIRAPLAAAEGVATATVNTAKDIEYGVKDTFKKFFGWFK